MTKPTGRAPGRPRGAINKASREQREKAAASGLLPHEFLLAVTRGEAIGDHVPTFAERLEAAKAAAPFFAPKLSAVDASVTANTDFARMSDEELEAFVRHGAVDFLGTATGVA